MNKFNMFITAVCVLFLIKLRWPKNKNNYFINMYSVKSGNFQENEISHARMQPVAIVVLVNKSIYREDSQISRDLSLATQILENNFCRKKLRKNPKSSLRKSSSNVNSPTLK